MNSEKVIEMLEQAQEYVPIRLYTWAGTVGVACSDACWVDVVRLASDQYAYRHNHPIHDTNWQVIGSFDMPAEIVDFWQNWRDNLLEAAIEGNLQELA